MPVSELVWEAVHGPVPPGFSILSRDGDPWNIYPDNLICVKLKRKPDPLVHRFEEPTSIYQYF